MCDSAPKTLTADAAKAVQIIRNVRPDYYPVGTRLVSSPRPVLKGSSLIRGDTDLAFGSASLGCYSTRIPETQYGPVGRTLYERHPRQILPSMAEARVVDTRQDPVVRHGVEITAGRGVDPVVVNEYPWRRVINPEDYRRPLIMNRVAPVPPMVSYLPSSGDRRGDMYYPPRVYDGLYPYSGYGSRIVGDYIVDGSVARPLSATRTESSSSAAVVSDRFTRPTSPNRVVQCAVTSPLRTSPSAPYDIVRSNIPLGDAVVRRLDVSDVGPGRYFGHRWVDSTPVSNVITRK